MAKDERWGDEDQRERDQAAAYAELIRARRAAEQANRAKYAAEQAAAAEQARQLREGTA